MLREDMGISIRVASPKLIMEEAPESYLSKAFGGCFGEMGDLLLISIIYLWPLIKPPSSVFSARSWSFCL